MTPARSSDFPEPLHETEGRIELVRDTSAARWIEERLWKWTAAGVKVGSVVPEGFEAYARILHPAQYRPGDGGGRIRWSTVAAWTGSTVHPTMQFDRIAKLSDRRDAPTWGYKPAEGCLLRDDCDRLAGHLRAFTAASDRCWFAVWEGYGFLDPRRYADVPTIKTPGRAYVLYLGPLDAVTSFSWGDTWQSPNLWWPDDRAWCVATEIDLPETYLGGSEACVNQVLADQELEAIRTTIDARVDAAADTINR